MICPYQTEGSVYSEFIVIEEKKEKKKERICERKDKTISMTVDYFNSTRIKEREIYRDHLHRLEINRVHFNFP